MTPAKAKRHFGNIAEMFIKTDLTDQIVTCR